MVLITKNKVLDKKNAIKLQGNTIYVLCPGQRAGHSGQVDKEPNWPHSTVLSYVTLAGTLLSIVSLCFLLCVYLTFRELRNLPGKCLINLSLGLLCYQSVFLGAGKSTGVESLCEAVAIFLHFFVLAAFSWMSVMAYDIANTFSGQSK